MKKRQKKWESYSNETGKKRRRKAPICRKIEVPLRKLIRKKIDSEIVREGNVKSTQFIKRMK